MQASRKKRKTWTTCLSDVFLSSLLVSIGIVIGFIAHQLMI